MTEEIWYQALLVLNNDEGKAAFGALMRSTIFGDIEPGHVIEMANEIKENNQYAKDGKHEWISSARTFPGTISYTEPSPEYVWWLRSERKKLYKSLDGEGNVFLIQNPACWHWSLDSHGRPTFSKPAPKPTGEKIIKKKNSSWQNSPVGR